MANLGQTIHGRCVTIGSNHFGKIMEIINVRGEFYPRYRIACHDGRERVVQKI